MSSEISNQKGAMISIVQNTVTPPIAAGLAVIPVFYGFMVKTAQQQQKPIPKFNLGVIWDGVKAAPTVGKIIGIQIVAQNFIEMIFSKTIKNKNEQTDFMLMLASAAIVGLVSARPLAIFQGQSAGMSKEDAIKALSKKQVGAIVIRETSFLFSLRISEPISKSLKSSCGDNKAVDAVSAFSSGVIGSVIGHPFDTALSCWQKKVEIKHPSHLMRGVTAKAITIGLFSVLYKFTKDKMDHTLETRK